MRCSTTMPPTNIPRCWLGCPVIRVGSSTSPDFGLVAQCGRELLLQDDPATHPPRRLSFDRRSTERYQCSPCRAQCSPKTVCLGPIRKCHPRQTRPPSCTL